MGFAFVRRAFALKEYRLPEERCSKLLTDAMRQSCEGDGRLLKFVVCWDAAVCAVSAGGFFSVWDCARKTDVRDGVRKASGWRSVLSA